ncbi:MAG: hypothetical protein Q9166_002423 [cf. Caloplaca sp. 2 TL-2023]
MIVDHGRKAVNSARSADSEQHPYSTDYNLHPIDWTGLHDPLPPEFKRRSYDVDNPSPQIDRLDDERKMEDLRFLQIPHYEDDWVAKKVLQHGSEGRTGLWEKSDQDGAVIDQIVIKQKIGRLDYKLRKPAEVKIMEDLCERPRNGIVRLRGYRRYPKLRAHRLYLDFCKHGDLVDLLNVYRSQRQYLPEEFIWDVFYHLVSACKVMDEGPSPSRQRYSWCKTYVHRDIKPENIFLAAPEDYDTDGIPIYPSTKLGDFGFAMATSDTDPHNPKDLRYKGTPGYKAPEQKDLALDKEDDEEYIETNVTNHSPQLGTHTNIWAIGACIYQLILLTAAHPDLHKAHLEKSKLEMITTHRTPEYSTALREVVHQCLETKPEHRPTLARLEEVVVANRSAFRSSWSSGGSIPEAAILRLSRDATNAMGIGPFVAKGHIHESTDLLRKSWLAEHDRKKDVENLVQQFAGWS